MEDLNSKIPLFKKIDLTVFDRIDKYKQTSGYSSLQDYYNGLEEDQQRIFKGALTAGLFIIPALLLAILWFQNAKVREDLELRTAIVSKGNEILGQNQGIREIGPSVMSESPIDSASMMTSRLSNVLSSMGIDLSKIQVKDFVSNMVTPSIMKSDAEFTFSALTTEELMNIFTGLIQREKFRVQDVSISRNADTGLLNGNFKAAHFSITSGTGTEEE